MNKAIQVIIIIAVVLSAVEILALIVTWFEPPKITAEPYLSNLAERAEIRWKVYWFVGAPLTIFGAFLKNKIGLIGYALLITGIYLMLFGNNGGFWSTGILMPRLITSFITLIGLLFLLRNERWDTNSTKE